MHEENLTRDIFYNGQMVTAVFARNKCIVYDRLVVGFLCSFLSVVHILLGLRSSKVPASLQVYFFSVSCPMLALNASSQAKGIYLPGSGQPSRSNQWGQQPTKGRSGRR